MLRCVVLGMILLGMCLPAGKSEAAPKIVINAVSSFPVNYVLNDIFKEYIKRVNEKSKGELEIKFLGGPEVVPAFDQMKSLANGVIDMAYTSPSYYTGTVAEGAVPELAKPSWVTEVKSFSKSPVFEVYVQAFLERSGLQFLGMPQATPFYFMLNKPISKLEEMKGLKLRSFGGLGDVLLGELGSSVVRIPSAETYEALQRGIVDGAFRNTTALVDFKEYEVMKYIVCPPQYTGYCGIWVEPNKWKGLPNHLRTLMTEVMGPIEEEGWKYYMDMDIKLLKEAQEKHGMKTIFLSDQDNAKLTEIRKGTAIKGWITKNAPKFGSTVYEKMLPYL